MHVSLGQYLLLLAFVLLIPLSYVCATAVGYYPPPGHRVLQDPIVAELLGVKNTTEVVINGWSPFGVGL